MSVAGRWNPLIAQCRQGVRQLGEGWHEEGLIIREDAKPPTLLYRMSNGDKTYVMSFQWNEQLSDPLHVDTLVTSEFVRMWTFLRPDR
jgi:hypothetical protein